MQSVVYSMVDKDIMDWLLKEDIIARLDSNNRISFDSYTAADRWLGKLLAHNSVIKLNVIF